MTSVLPTRETSVDEEYQAVEERLVEAARGLREHLIAEQAEAEKRSYFSEETHRRFEEAGFYRMQIPKKYGGYEVTPQTFFRVATEISRGCMSTGWCMTLSANHALLVANWFPAEIHEEIFNNGDFRAASMYAPLVQATPVDGGWELNGTVNYCSGIPYSTHFLGQAVLPGTDAEGNPRLGIYIAPRAQFTQLDDWGDTLGLKASGSHSIRFDGGVIPSSYMIEDADLTLFGFDGPSPGSAAYGNPMYTGRHMSTFTCSLAAVCIGGGYNLLDAYEHEMRTRKTSLPPFVPRTEDPDYLRWYGAAFVKLSTAEAALNNVLDQWLELAVRNHTGTGTFSSADDNRLGAIARELMIQVWEAIDEHLFRTVGASTIRNGTRFERLFRDLAQAASHRNPQLREIVYRGIAMERLGLI